MKATIDKMVFTIAEKDSAKEYMKQSEWCRDQGVISQCARKLCEKILGTEKYLSLYVLKYGSIKVTRDRYKCCNRVENMFVLVNGFDDNVMDDSKIIQLSFSIQPVYHEERVTGNYSVLSVQDDGWNKIVY